MGDVMVMNAIEATASRRGIDQSQINLDSIRLQPGDNFGIISDDEDVYEDDQLEFDSGFGNIIMVDNLPIVSEEKFEKLEGVIRKIYSQIGVIKDDGLWMPVDPQTHKTLGYCFIEFNTPQVNIFILSLSELAKEKTNGYKLDKAHIFAVNMFDNFDRFMKVPDEWGPPEFKPYTPGDNLQQWLTDEKARDQFVIRAGSDTEVLWNDARHLKPEPVYKRTYWTESFVQWTPLGTYLATVHRQGAAVWGGADTFNRLMRYAHPQVKLIDFSPGEKYLVTYSSHEPSNPRDANRVIINIFDVRTCKVMRDFRGSADEFAVGGTGGVASWPIVRWGGGKDKYFAKLGKNMISVYETETFSLIDKKSLKVENVMDFNWSPTDPILSLYVPELGGGNQPARVSLIQIPGKEELRQKGAQAGYQSSLLSFYSMRTAHNTGWVSKLTTLKGKQANALFWSPSGRFIVLAGLKGFNGQLEFYNVDELETMATAEHFMATDIEWDPTGRYVATAVTSVHEMENGFNVWSFNGKLLYRTLKDRFFQFLWRPRSPSFLTPEDEEEIAKNLKIYSKKYEAEDQDVSMLLSEQEREKRKMLKDEWEKWVNEWKLLHEEEKLERHGLRDGEASGEEEEYEAKDIEVEEVLEVTEEVLPFDD
ncbi:hypothetical protein Ddye_025274 [Dipteronia dyeriana]|uniref:Eukaryotic translation initiation factor 3 subunit B n=1 Tax=Dipteronia dyeriana TaxID=168575 RepID=A0AAD9TWK1_9ROSI|nr:hypothetical protein Ddye_025274 [Dipteronia dyeriana]